MSPFGRFSAGDTVTRSPHSVCLSLPTMADVVAYEEKDPALMNRIQAGYPRFFTNPLISRLENVLQDDGLLEPGDPLLPTAASAEDLAAFLGLPASRAYAVDSFWSLSLRNDPNALQTCRLYLQHTGSRIASREAEARLHERGIGVPYQEERYQGNAVNHIRAHLHDIYGTAAPDDIHLFRGGMNAFYAGFRALQAIQLRRQRDVWIQLGWLYVDTIRILEKWAVPGTEVIQLFDVVDFLQLKDVLRTHGHRVAGIVTEVPTNPLVQTPDVERLHELARKHGVALVLDPTLVSPHNVNVLPFCDVHINSLTKYACQEADVMLGALALNHQSPFYDDLRQLVPVWGTPPSAPDAARLAYQIDHYPQLIQSVNERTPQLVDFLANHPKVRSVHWAKADNCAYQYNWIQHRSAGPGAIISVSLNGDISAFYDRTAFVKSPSFGARFSMLCPFMYLAHYDLVSTKDGRAFLSQQQIDPELIRFSTGTESIGDIIDEWDRSLSFL